MRAPWDGGIGDLLGEWQECTDISGQVKPVLFCPAHTCRSRASYRKPFVAVAAPVAGVLAAYHLKREMSNPAESERNITGMNGQDFEGINNR